MSATTSAGVSPAARRWLSFAGASCREKLQRCRWSARVPVSALVIAVPTHFVEGDRQAIYEACLSLNLPLLRILNAPTAAALACRPRLSDGTIVLALDLGLSHMGGALIRLAAQPEILATSHAHHHFSRESVLALPFQLLERQVSPTALVLSGYWTQEERALSTLTNALGFQPDPGLNPAFAAACGAALQGLRLSQRAA